MTDSLVNTVCFTPARLAQYCSTVIDMVLICSLAEVLVSSQPAIHLLSKDLEDFIYEMILEGFMDEMI